LNFVKRNPSVTFALGMKREKGFQQFEKQRLKREDKENNYSDIL
jgi:hypothetical protein